MTSMSYGITGPCLDKVNLKEDDFLMHPSVQQIKQRRPCSNFLLRPAYVSTLLYSIDENKANGPDNIAPNIRNIYGPAISESLTGLSNHCISISTWPSRWKPISNVSPDFKKEDTMDKTNYHRN